MDEAFDLCAEFARALEEDMGAEDVRVCEFVGVSEREVDVGLSGEVEDGVDVVGAKGGGDRGGRGDVAVDECEVGEVGETAGVVEGSAVVEFVEGDDVVVRVG